MSIKSATKSTPGWYQRFFAWLLAHGNAKYEAEMSDRKRELFADLHGNVLEIGPGTGPICVIIHAIFIGLGLSQILICILTFSKKQNE